MMSRRTPYRLVLLAVVALTLAACGGGSKPVAGKAGTGGGSQATQGASGGKQIDVSITGHIKTTSKTEAPHGTVNQLQSLDWTVTLVGTLSDINSGNAVPQITALSGQVFWSGTGGIPCHGNLVKSSQLSNGDLQGLLTLEPPGDPNPAMNSGSGVGPPNTQGSSDYLVEAVVPSKAFVSTDTNPADSQCNTPVIPGMLLSGPPQSDPKYKEWQQALAPYALFDAGGKSTDATFSTSWSGPIPSGESAVGTTVTGTAEANYSFAWH